LKFSSRGDIFAIFLYLIKIVQSVLASNEIKYFKQFHLVKIFFTIPLQINSRTIENNSEQHHFKRRGNKKYTFEKVQQVKKYQTLNNSRL
jgi:hypothetical protein